MHRAILVLSAAAIVVSVLVASVSAAPAQSPSIAKTAASAPEFSTLVSLLKKAGLVKALDGKGTYTVFAPTNAAFKRLPASTLEAVGNDPALLKKVLLYHVVKGGVPAAKVVTLNGKSVKTLAGPSVKVSVRGGKVFLNGSTRVTKTDIRASNGVIHVVNRVLVPGA